METEVYVYVDIVGTPHLTGRLWRTCAKVGKGLRSNIIQAGLRM